MSQRIRFVILMLLLAVSCVAVEVLPSAMQAPDGQKLSRFPLQIGEWSGQELPRLSNEEQRVLKANDYLSRVYRHNGQSVELFVAYYSSQKSGEAIHSPKNCLPGAGWQVISSEIVSVPASKEAVGLEANHFLIEKDDVQQDVVYWYQASGRKFASEYTGKLYLIWNALTKNRTDGALIRITSVRRENSDSRLATITDFGKELAPILPRFLPD